MLMLTRWRALVGFTLLTLVVHIAGPRVHLHPGHEDGLALVHSHGAGEPHRHDRAPSTPEDQSDGVDPVIVVGAARVLLSPSRVTPLSAPLFPPGPVAIVAAVAAWTPTPDTTPVHAHGPPFVRLLPPRAPPPDPLQLS